MWWSGGGEGRGGELAGRIERVEGGSVENVKGVVRMVGGEVVVEEWARKDGMTKGVTQDAGDRREWRNRRSEWRERTELPFVERRPLEEQRRAPARSVENARGGDSWGRWRWRIQYTFA